MGSTGLPELATDRIMALCPSVSDRPPSWSSLAVTVFPAFSALTAGAPERLAWSATFKAMASSAAITQAGA
jgi:hypothetical protein